MSEEWSSAHNNYVTSAEDESRLRRTCDYWQDQTRLKMCRLCGVMPTVGVQVRPDGTFGSSRVAFRDDSSTVRDEDAAEVCRRSCSRAANSGSADIGPFAKSHCDEPAPETCWKLLSLWQQSATCEVKRDGVTFLVVRILRYRQSQTVARESRSPQNNVLRPHLRHADATQPTLEVAKYFESPACEDARCLRVARQSSPCEVQLPLKSIAMDVKELTGWVLVEKGRKLCMFSVKEAPCKLWFLPETTTLKHLKPFRDCRPKPG